MVRCQRLGSSSYRLTTSMNRLGEEIFRAPATSSSDDSASVASVDAKIVVNGDSLDIEVSVGVAKKTITRTRVK